jgi:hypothetical protein
MIGAEYYGIKCYRMIFIWKRKVNLQTIYGHARWAAREAFMAHPELR